MICITRGHVAIKVSHWSYKGVFVTHRVYELYILCECFVQFIHQPPFILYLATLHRPHINNSTDAVALLHGIESVVDLTQVLSVGDELVDLEVALHVVGDKVVHLRATLDATKGATLPHTTSDELECYKLSV